MSGFISKKLQHASFTSHYLLSGEGDPILLIHGSGPGVSAQANWQGMLDSPVAERFELIAPDVVGFGQTDAPPDFEFTHESRLDHLVNFMDALGKEKFRVVGNSMGGALALGLAYLYPERIESMVLMGAVGISFELTEPLDAVWGYEPSVEAMEQVIRYLAYDQSRVQPNLVQMRYEASIAAGVHERYSAAFAAPRQRHIESMALTPDQLSSIKTRTLLIHGVHDVVVPLGGTSIPMMNCLPNADLIVLGRCGHWTQIERATDFQKHVVQFFEEPPL